MIDLASETMARDVFPAEVYAIGGGVLTKCRVFITSHRMIVWGLGRGGVVEKKLEVELAEPLGVFASRSVLGPRESIEVATLTKGYIVNKGRGCNCGSSLKALAPPAPWKG